MRLSPSHHDLITFGHSHPGTRIDFVGEEVVVHFSQDTSTEDAESFIREWGAKVTVPCHTKKPSNLQNASDPAASFHYASCTVIPPLKTPCSCFSAAQPARKDFILSNVDRVTNNEWTMIKHILQHFEFAMPSSWSPTIDKTDESVRPEIKKLFQKLLDKTLTEMDLDGIIDMGAYYKEVEQANRRLIRENSALQAKLRQSSISQTSGASKKYMEHLYLSYHLIFLLFSFGFVITFFLDRVMDLELFEDGEVYF